MSVSVDISIRNLELDNIGILNNWTSVYVLPFIIGMSFQTPRPPTDVNCPRDVSRKKSGMPANTSVRKYGIRKAPAKIREREETKKPHHQVDVLHLQCLSEES